MQRLPVEKCRARKGDWGFSLLGFLGNERHESHPPPEEDGIAVVKAISQLVPIVPGHHPDADAGRP